MSTILDEIVAHARDDARERERLTPRAELETRAREQAPARSLVEALRRGDGPLRVLGELKRQSPSAGIIHADLDPAAAATALEAAGCAALSVLTEARYFGGSLEALEAARSAVRLPLLRKDFVVGTYQVVEARAHGADAVLLLASVLDDAALRDCADCAREWGMAVLAEAHTDAELDRILDLDLPIVGINARDLKTFAVDLDRILAARDRVPADRVAVAESGVRSAADAARVSAAGFDAVLCGEGLMRGGDPTARMRELFGEPA